MISKLISIVVVIYLIVTRLMLFLLCLYGIAVISKEISKVARTYKFWPFRSSEKGAT